MSDELRRVRRLVAMVILGILSACSGSGGGTGRDRAAEPTHRGCLPSEVVVSLAGTHYEQVRYPDPLAGTTFDAREATLLSYPNGTLYPLGIGKDSVPAAARLCVLGGLILGQQSRTLTWDEMKVRYDGDAVRVDGNNPYVFDGLRVDNVEDGVAPRGTEGRYPKDGDGFVMRNLYMTYIRDDCVENDDIAGGLIYDSLFDGCNTGMSERPSSGDRQNDFPAPPGERVTLDRVLLRLQAMPGPRGTNDPNVLGHGQLFKWSSVANKLVIKDSIFLVEKTPNSTTYWPFPPGTITENVTIVWLGSGKFKWEVPAGTTVTRNRSDWDSARATWLARHGCTSFIKCTKLFTPDPIS